MTEQEKCPGCGISVHILHGHMHTTFMPVMLHTVNDRACLSRQLAQAKATVEQRNTDLNQLQREYDELSSAIMGGEPIDDHQCNVSIAQDGARALECSSERLKEIDELAQAKAEIEKLRQWIDELADMSLESMAAWQKEAIICRKAAEEAKEAPDGV